MIVLDEQLKESEIAEAILRWYSGKVDRITDLRPGTIIKDEAVSALLAAANKPTFVTINVYDFWEVVPADSKYCIVCLSIQDSRVGEVPVLLRRLLRMPEFKTRQLRMGKVIRVGGDASGMLVEFYARETPQAVTRTRVLP